MLSLSGEVARSADRVKQESNDFGGNNHTLQFQYFKKSSEFFGLIKKLPRPGWVMEKSGLSIKLLLSFRQLRLKERSDLRIFRK